MKPFQLPHRPSFFGTKNLYCQATCWSHSISPRKSYQETFKRVSRVMRWKKHKYLQYHTSEVKLKAWYSCQWIMASGLKARVEYRVVSHTCQNKSNGSVHGAKCTYCSSVQQQVCLILLDDRWRRKSTMKAGQKKLCKCSFNLKRAPLNESPQYSSGAYVRHMVKTSTQFEITHTMVCV